MQLTFSGVHSAEDQYHTIHSGSLPMQLKEVRKLTHLLIHLKMSGSIKIIYFHLWFVSKLKSSLALDSLTVESRKEKSCNILCCRVCPCPGWWCLHTHSGHHPFIGRDTQKWADMKHLPEEIAREIAGFVPKASASTTTEELVSAYRDKLWTQRFRKNIK